jgi:hypothetical protein
MAGWVRPREAAVAVVAAFVVAVGPAAATAVHQAGAAVAAAEDLDSRVAAATAVWVAEQRVGAEAVAPTTV